MGNNILVIKLGALGDFIQAAGPFAAIRAHHAGDHVTLLTTQPYAAFAEESPWFDAVWIDARPRALQIGAWRDLRRRLRGGAFQRVYDLQTSERSSSYLRLFWPGPGPEWSGIARGASHPHANPDRDRLHTIERQTDQLVMAGLAAVPEADFSWIDGDAAGRFALPKTYALLIPGGARHRPEKRWPANRFSALAARLKARGVTPVVLGTADEAPLARDIAKAAPGTRDLTGKTEIADLFSLAQGAALAVGNDTGPMHAAAAAGCRTIVLFSAGSDPALCAPRGRRVTVLQRDDLASLAVDEVVAMLDDPTRVR